MNRDWNKDMELCQEHEYLKKLCSGWEPVSHGRSAPVEDIEEILKYWLQQYATEKERADRLESELETAYNEVEKLQREYAHLDETSANDYDQLTAAEAREKKLREAIEEEVKCHILLGTYKRADELRELLASLYPKEEESK